MLDNSKIQNLGYIAWKNDLAWMEDQKGEKWRRLIETENERFRDSLDIIQTKLTQFKKSMKFKQSSLRSWTWRGWTVNHATYSPQQEWHHKGSGRQLRGWDADTSSDHFAIAVQDLNGFERFTVEIYTNTPTGSAPRHLKTIEQTGPYVAFLDGDLIYLGSSADLRYDSVYLWNPETDQTTVLYETRDPTQNLELGRGQDGSVYVINSDFVMNRVGFIYNSGIHWRSRSSTQVFVESFQHVLTEHTQFPGIPKDHVVESMSLRAGWLVTRSYGIRTLWKITDDKVTSVVVVWGDILFDARDPYRLDISDIRYEPYIIHLQSWKITKLHAYVFPCSHMTYPVPIFVVYPNDTTHLKGLLVIAYGAYGTPTHIGSTVKRWKPLLVNGWVVACVMVPGSGDHDVAWKARGQRERRQVSIDALRKAVVRLQRSLNIPSYATALYGRSAGGLLVISTAVQTPGLVGALYVESPYVDVLRTITNPALPLTELETREFGIGSCATDVISTAAWSPMEHIPDQGIPGLFVVARTSLTDLEVYPYEVLKFIRRIRGAGGGGLQKLVYVHDGLGHFATSEGSRAEDLALLDQWLRLSPDRETGGNIYALRVKNRSTKYKMLSRKDRKNRATRKNRKDRKDRKNKNEMMGGKRRSMSRKSRKARKGSRRH